jgi:hypothetical protein
MMKKVEYVFLVLQKYKGQIKSDTLKLVNGIGIGDCGYNFTIGSDFIVYSVFLTKYFEMGKNVDKFLYTDICTRTRRIDKKD